MDKQPLLRTPLKRARGLGSGHGGTHHFWVQRVSAVALIPLSIWFIVQLVCHLLDADRAGLAQWLHHPLTALAMAALIAGLFVHARLGIQIIIGDYVHCDVRRAVMLIALDFLILGFGVASLMAIARLHFIGI